MHKFNRFRALLLALPITALLFACVSNAPVTEDPIASRAGQGGKIRDCKAGDNIVTSPEQCLQDDAACYQLTNGAWCTGPRGMNCPTGAHKLEQGQRCPEGSRCFTYRPGLTCAISLQ